MSLWSLQNPRHREPRALNNGGSSSHVLPCTCPPDLLKGSCTVPVMNKSTIHSFSTSSLSTAQVCTLGPGPPQPWPHLCQAFPGDPFRAGSEKPPFSRVILRALHLPCLHLLLAPVILFTHQPPVHLSHPGAFSKGQPKLLLFISLSREHPITQVARHH